MSQMVTVGKAEVVRESGPRAARIESVDALRGVVMIIMVIDHIRDYLHWAAMSFSPTDIGRTTAAIFFTRWVTHFCAPVFVFTAGISAYLWLQRGRSKRELSRFLLTRGIWLIVLELTLLRFVMFIDLGARPIFLLVIYALGCCMIALAALIYLPLRALAILSVATIIGHNLLDGTKAAQFGQAAWVWDILHEQAVFKLFGTTWLSAYPLVPYFAIMSAGFCFGAVFKWEGERRQRMFIRLGLGLTIAFVVVRWLNMYGDPSRWSVQPTKLFTLLSFLNTTKYPPSLDFLLMTLGPAILSLAWLERRRFSSTNPMVIFGRVPFFYYVVHLAVIHAVSILMNFVRYGKTDFLFLPAPSMGGPSRVFPPGFGYDLWVVYAVWAGTLVLLYPLCRWYAGLKQRRRDLWWLSYL